MNNIAPKIARAASAIAAFAAMGLAATAAPAADGAPKGDGGVIRMMASPYGSQSFIPFVIEKYDLDTKYGFQLERITFSDSKAAAAAVQSGGAEIAVFDWNGVALMRNAGIDVIGVAPFLTYVSSIVVPSDSPMKGIPDLSGKKFGIFSRTSVDWIRADIIQAFSLETNAVLQKTFDILVETAGAKALGMEKMPDRIVTLDFQ